MAVLIVHTMPLTYIHAARVYTSARPTQFYSTFTLQAPLCIVLRKSRLYTVCGWVRCMAPTKWYHQALHMKHWNLGGSGSPYMFLRSMTHDCEHGASWLILWCRHMPWWVCPIMSAWLCLNPHPRCSHCWRMYGAKNSYHIRS